MMNMQGRSFKSLLNAIVVIALITFGIQLIQPLLEVLISLLDTYLLLDNSLTFVLFIVLMLCITFRYLAKITNWNIEYFLILLIIYCLFRFLLLDKEWSFILFYKISYFDVSFTLILCSIVVTKCRKRKNWKENGPHKIPSDNSVKKKEEDLLGYYKYAKSLLEHILKSKDLYLDGSYSVGILGKWGQGKSSFVNLMKYALEEDSDQQKQSFSDKAIWIEFNPWRSNDEKQIIKDFINKLESSLTPFNPLISINAQKYLDVLVRADFGFFSKFLNLVMPHKYDSVDYRFTELNDSIIQIGKPIIIVIEDIDRLVATEILQVLKLIRNTANFKNCIFLIPYDNDYILKTLNNGGIVNSSDYLTKMINTNYSLPRLSQEYLNKYYIEILNASLLLVHNKDNDESIRNFVNDANLHFTLREIKKLAREVNSCSGLLLDNDDMSLYLYDYLLIRLLEIKNPILYRSLYILEDRKRLLKIVNDDVYLLNINNKGLVTESDYISYSEEQKSFFNENNKSLSLRIMKLLFSEEHNRGRKHNHRFRLNRAVSFNLYFENSVDDSFIVKSEFEQIFLLKEDEASMLLKEIGKKK